MKIIIICLSLALLPNTSLAAVSKSTKKSKIVKRSQPTTIKKLIIPEFKLQDANLDKCLKTLSTLSIKHDPNGIGYDCLPIIAQKDKKKVESKKVSLNLRKVSIEQLAKIISLQFNLHYSLENHLISFHSANSAKSKMKMKAFKIRTGVFPVGRGSNRNNINNRNNNRRNNDSNNRQR